MASDAKIHLVKTGVLNFPSDQDPAVVRQLLALRQTVLTRYRSASWATQPYLAAAAGGTDVSPLLLQQYDLSWASLSLPDSVQNSFLLGDQLHIGRLLMDMGQEEGSVTDACHAALIVIVAGLIPNHHCQLWLGSEAGRELPEGEHTQFEIPFAQPWREWVFEFTQITNRDLDVQLQDPLRMLFQPGAKDDEQSWGGQLHLSRDFTKSHGA